MKGAIAAKPMTTRHVSVMKTTDMKIMPIKRAVNQMRNVPVPTDKTAHAAVPAKRAKSNAIAYSYARIALFHHITAPPPTVSGGV